MPLSTEKGNEQTMTNLFRLLSLDGLPSSPSSLGVGDAHLQEPAPKRPCVIDLCSDSEDPSDPVWDGSENGEGEVLEDCEDAEEEEEEEPADDTEQYPDWLSYLPYDRAHDEPDTEWSDEEQKEMNEKKKKSLSPDRGLYRGSLCLLFPFPRWSTHPWTRSRILGSPHTLAVGASRNISVCSSL
jgi:hypothetical protein